MFEKRVVSNSLVGKYIYEIRIGKRVYIGQSEASGGSSRIHQHIVNAYYGKSLSADPTVGELYHDMNEHRICDLDIRIYRETDDFGISNFKEAYEQFRYDWVPIGLRITRNEMEKFSTDIKPIDFAEIFHILRREYEGYTLYNTQMGGKISGLGFREEVFGSDDGYVKDNKVLMANTSPSKAISLILSGAESANLMNKITREMYNIMFTDEWKKENPPSSIEQTWTEFFNNQLLPYITTQIAGRLQYQYDANTNITNYINRYFIEPRAGYAVEIIRRLMKKEGPGITQAPFNIKKQFDFNMLTDYIADAVTKLIYKIPGVDERVKLTSNQKHIKTVSTIRPLRMDVVWKLYQPHKVKGGEWLTNNNILEGFQMPEDELKYESLLVFNNAFTIKKQSSILYLLDRSSTKTRNNKRKAKRWWKYAADTSLITEDEKFLSDLGENVIKGYTLDPEDWLASRMKEWYDYYCPAYTRDWYRFYRSMVSWWRIAYCHLRPLQELEYNNTTYLYSDLSDFTIVYSSIKNVVNAGNIEDVIIY